jgi:sigma-B regulation protein RsbU (phosphoserine phosphatase)
MKILIADDNKDMIYLIKKRFDPENYIFIEAYDGEETLTRVRDEHPDLILLDLKMPRKNGMEVLKEIKEDFELKDIPVIVLTVVSDEKEKIRALEIGANDFLVKPPEAAELRARVHTQLEILKATNIFKKYSLHLEGMVSRKMRELKEYANRLEEMVDEKVGVIRKQNEDLLFSLKAAKKVQKSLLPPESVSIESIEFESIYFPLEAIGGDFYDIFRIDEDHIGVFISDVSGHGLPSAMITIFLKREVVYHSKKVLGKGKYTITRPKEVLMKLNKSFIKNKIGEGKYFVTMIYGIYSLSKRRLELSIAGHHALPLWKKKNGDIEVIRLNGFPIGWFLDGYEYDETGITLSPGESILFYTDGIFEIILDEDKKATFNNLIDTMIDFYRKDDVIPYVAGYIRKFIKKNNQLSDDITQVLMKIN